MNSIMKLSIAFLAGVLVIAGDLYLSGVRFAAPMFLAGALAVLVPMFGALGSVARVRAIARFLNAFADAWQGKQAKAEPVSDPLADDVASALTNQGVTPKLARRIAVEAVKGNKDLDSAIRAGLALVPRKVA